MVKKYFVEKYCRLCGSQLCFGIEDLEFRDGCKYYQEHFGKQKKNIEVQRKKPVAKRIYEDDDWVIDLIDGNIKVSYFEGNHFVDDIVLTKDSFK